VNDRLKAILLVMGAMAAFAVLDTSAKIAAQDLPVLVGVFFRYLIALGLAAAIVLRAGGAPLLRTHHPVLQAMRGLLLLGSTACNFTAISYLQLAQTAAINFTLPLWVCALSVPLLGEHVGVRRWLAVCIGFLGVLVIMRPGSMEFHWAMLVSLLGAIFGACYNIATRKVGAADSTQTSLFYVGLVGSLGASMPLWEVWQTPHGWQWLPLLLMGLAGTAGHSMLIKAHRLAPASAIAPFNYTQIIWMTVSGMAVFGQFPDGWTLLGAGIVVASGAYVFARERKMGVTTAQEATPED
jgi:drug/metabolite transporter (DMT)-like permease